VNDPEVKAGPGAVIDDLQTALAKGALGEPLTAQQRLAELVSPDAVDRMLADAESAGVSIDGPDGLLGQLTRTVLERALGAELDDHLGYVKGDPAGNGSGNSRNRSYGKTVTTTAGPVRIAVPRDRNSTFEPVIVPKGRRRIGQVDDMILSLYARGMTTRDIQAHLAEVYGAEVSPALVSRVTDVVAEEITAWQTRPLDAFYAILYIDALMVKVRDGGAVDNKAAYLVTGVDIDGFKHVLGIWLAASEGSRFWAGVLTERATRLWSGRGPGTSRWPVPAAARKPRACTAITGGRRPTFRSTAAVSWCRCGSAGCAARCWIVPGRRSASRSRASCTTGRPARSALPSGN
jgi:putative transposase